MTGADSVSIKPPNKRANSGSEKATGAPVITRGGRTGEEGGSSPEAGGGWADVLACRFGQSRTEDDPLVGAGLFSQSVAPLKECVDGLLLVVLSTLSSIRSWLCRRSG